MMAASFARIVGRIALSLIMAIIRIKLIAMII